MKKTRILSAIILAAGKGVRMKSDKPKVLFNLCGKTILERQLENIRKVGLHNMTIVRGYKGEMIDYENMAYYENSKFEEKHSLYSLFCARKNMENGFVLLYSDILFNEDILKSLIQNEDDIVLLVDNSYRYHKHDIDKKLDLVVSKTKQSSFYRTLKPSTMM